MKKRVKTIGLDGKDYKECLVQKPLAINATNEANKWLVLASNVAGGTPAPGTHWNSRCSTT